MDRFLKTAFCIGTAVTIALEGSVMGLRQLRDNIMASHLRDIYNQAKAESSILGLPNIRLVFQRNNFPRPVPKGDLPGFDVITFDGKTFYKSTEQYFPTPSDSKNIIDPASILVPTGIYNTIVSYNKDIPFSDINPYKLVNLFSCIPDKSVFKSDETSLRIGFKYVYDENSVLRETWFTFSGIVNAEFRKGNGVSGVYTLPQHWAVKFRDADTIDKQQAFIRRIISEITDKTFDNKQPIGDQCLEIPYHENREG